MCTFSRLGGACCIKLIVDANRNCFLLCHNYSPKFFLLTGSYPLSISTRYLVVYLKALKMLLEVLEGAFICIIIKLLL